jgi:hypothetical protein
MAPWEQGRAAAPGEAAITEALRLGLALRRAPVGIQGFNVTDIAQSGKHVSLKGDISSVDAFDAVFDILTGYTARTLEAHRGAQQ